MKCYFDVIFLHPGAAGINLRRVRKLYNMLRDVRILDFDIVNFRTESLAKYLVIF